MSIIATTLIIIGGGPAALTAAIYAARANLKPIVFEGTMPGGQLMGTTAIENWPGNISILGPDLMINMRAHAVDMGAEIISQEVASVDLSKKPFRIVTSRGQEYTAKALIVATGAKPNKLSNCPGQDEYWGKGVTTCAVCDGALYKDKKVVIVGGGDTAMEDASFMTHYTRDITIVQNLEQLSATYAMQQRVVDNPDIKIIYNSTVTAIKGDGAKVTGITITNLKTNQVTELATDGVFLAIGLKPTTELFKGQLELTSYGYLKVSDGTKTSKEGVFGAGDVADPRYKQAITSAGTGCMATLDAERYLKTYKE